MNTFLQTIERKIQAALNYDPFVEGSLIGWAIIIGCWVLASAIRDHARINRGDME